MSGLLIEVFGEEIPARFQHDACTQLQEKIGAQLKNAGLGCGKITGFVTPRRLAVHIEDIPSCSAPRQIETRGPKLGAPQAAIDGFLRKTGLSDIAKALQMEDPKKGSYYLARSSIPGQPAMELIRQFMPQLIEEFSFPKSMRWGCGTLRWVRPLHSIICLYWDDEQKRHVIEPDIPGVKVLDHSFGHRFLSPGPVRIEIPEDYSAQLEKAYVIAEAERRREIIAKGAKDLAQKLGLALVEDKALLQEICGLVEWPVLLSGKFDERYLALPDEVIRLTIRAHQKCFVLKAPETGALANRFILVANIAAPDNGQAIITGNERVISARLADAEFFYQSDLAIPLERQGEKLNRVTFHKSLGSQGQRVNRLEELSAYIGGITGVSEKLARRAAKLAKADLVTQMVGEFAELQGFMGSLYAAAQGEDRQVAAAINEHYDPRGAEGQLPQSALSCTLALADRFDLLTALWAAGEKPSGSRDPFALRRAALAIIRIIIGAGYQMDLPSIIKQAHGLLAAQQDLPAINSRKPQKQSSNDDIVDQLMQFIIERFQQYLRDNGERADLINAVLAGKNAADLVAARQRIMAISRVLNSDAGHDLLAGAKRATNILRAEEKKEGQKISGAPDPALFCQDEEHNLASAIENADRKIQSALARKDFESAANCLADLRSPIDNFFDAVLVNDPQAKIRQNRLRLLAAIHEATAHLADLSLIGDI